jgi:thioredoxin-like negative regulator of GroEL
MYWQAALLIVALLCGVAAFSYAPQRDEVAVLPSSYDSGLSLEQAVSSSKGPVLIEFYQDECQQCRQLAPVLYQLHESRFKKASPVPIPLVMLNIDRPQNKPFLSLFGVTQVPALFVFNPKQMKKQPVPLAQVRSTVQLCQTIEQAYNEAKVAKHQKALPSTASLCETSAG